MLSGVAFTFSSVDLADAPFMNDLNICVFGLAADSALSIASDDAGLAAETWLGAGREVSTAVFPEIDVFPGIEGGLGGIKSGFAVSVLLATGGLGMGTGIDWRFCATAVAASGSALLAAGRAKENEVRFE